MDSSQSALNNLHRRSIRLKGYDYSQRGLYFVTICAHRKRCLFGKIANRAVRLTPLGRIVQQGWLQIPLHFPHVELQAFVVMPNHVHGILAIVARAQHAAPLHNPGTSPSHTRRVAPGSVAAIIRSFKAAVTNRARILRACGPDPIWQRNYYERVLRSGEELGDACSYIWENPLRWDTDVENPVRRPDPTHL